VNPKIETINFAYFIPGIILIAGVFFTLVDQEEANTLVDLLEKLNVTAGLLFLGFAYVIGYAMWAISDVAFRNASDGYFGKYLFFYICREKYIHKRCMEILSYDGSDIIVNEIDRLTK
jgi:hypothetical protein